MKICKNLRLYAKYCISVLFVAVFLFNIERDYVVFTLLQNNIQREIKQQIRKGLKEEDLSLIVTDTHNESEIRWIKPGKEFRFEGELYDIVKTRIIDQKTCYYCIRDIKEKQLIANYTKTHNNRKRAENTIKKLSQNPLFFQKITTSFNISSTDFHYNSKSSGITAKYLIIPSPPPENV
jgi:hypothetical protein